MNAVTEKLEAMGAERCLSPEESREEMKQKIKQRMEAIEEDARKTSRCGIIPQRSMEVERLIQFVAGLTLNASYEKMPKLIFGTAGWDGWEKYYGNINLSPEEQNKIVEEFYGQSEDSMTSEKIQKVAEEWAKQSGITLEQLQKEIQECKSEEEWREMLMAKYRAMTREQKQKVIEVVNFG